MEYKNKFIEKVGYISVLTFMGLIIGNDIEAKATKFTRRLSAFVSRNGSIRGGSSGTPKRAQLSSSTFKPSGSSSNLSEVDETPIVIEPQTKRNSGIVENGVIIGKNDKGKDIYAFRGAKIDSDMDIIVRNKILLEVKQDIRDKSDDAAAIRVSRIRTYRLLNYEPDSSERDVNTGERIYTHTNSDYNITVKISVDKDGDLNLVTVNSDGVKYKIDHKNDLYTVEKPEATKSS